MQASCRNCAFGGGYCSLTGHAKGGAYGESPCANYQPDPVLIARATAQAHEESQRRLQEEQHKNAVELQRQQDAREEAKRKEEEKRRRKEAARLRAAERRENYKEINGEPYTSMAVRAAIGILPHLFKKK